MLLMFLGVEDIVMESDVQKGSMFFMLLIFLRIVWDSWGVPQTHTVKRGCEWRPVGGPRVCVVLYACYPVCLLARTRHLLLVGLLGR